MITTTTASIWICSICGLLLVTDSDLGSRWHECPALRFRCVSMTRTSDTDFTDTDFTDTEMMTTPRAGRPPRPRPGRSEKLATSRTSVR